MVKRSHQVLIAALLAVTGPIEAGRLDPMREYRYCGAPPRNANGDILRRADVLIAFKREHPCPSTGSKTGSCPGWAIDHVIPLQRGGCDSVHNLQWLPNEIKSCAGTKCKDRWERKVYDQRL